MVANTSLTLAVLEAHWLRKQSHSDEISSVLILDQIDLLWMEWWVYNIYMYIFT